MISSNRNNYASSEEWLAAVKDDEKWHCQLKQLKNATPDKIRVMYKEADDELKKGNSWYSWRVYDHSVESVVKEMWVFGEVTLSNLLNRTIALLTLEWIEQHQDLSPCITTTVSGSQKMETAEEQEEQFRFVHPAIIDDEQAWKIHKEVKKLVRSHDIKTIRNYLVTMSKEKKVLLPQNAENLYNELVRLGMSNGEGFSLKTFQNHY